MVWCNTLHIMVDMPGSVHAQWRPWEETETGLMSVRRAVLHDMKQQPTIVELSDQE